MFQTKYNSRGAFEIILNATMEGIFIFDKNRHCKFVNKVAVDMFDSTQEDMLGKSALEFIAPESHELLKTKMAIEKILPYEAVVQKSDGSTFPALLRGHDIMLDGEEVRISAVIDITENKKREAEILKLAHYDTLTSLPNRSLFKEYMNKAIKNTLLTTNYQALLFIDLDNFKTVNDTVGHNIGDLVLVETAKRIKNAINANASVARLGGDEFVVLINSQEQVKSKVLLEIEIATQKILDALQVPYMVQNNDFRMTASIGIKLFNDDTLSMDELMKYADSAMYNAKAEGKNTFCFFDPKQQRLMEEKILLTESLRTAIDEMELYYQPQVAVDERIVGVEALIRWNHPTKGLISPLDFIPVAEESGFIITLGKWIINEAIHQLSIWENDEIKSKWRVSINVSAKQFGDLSFMPIIKEALDKHKVKSEKIRLELTESILVENIEETLEKLEQLKAMGFSLSIDDFGTGYSSLSYLRKLPMTELKVDQSFIKDLMSDENDEIITQTIISIGKKFKLEVIAEGVETRKQYEKLISMGCENFQGYLFSKPVKAELL